MLIYLLINFSTPEFWEGGPARAQCRLRATRGQHRPAPGARLATPMATPRPRPRAGAARWRRQRAGGGGGAAERRESPEGRRGLPAPLPLPSSPPPLFPRSPFPRVLPRCAVHGYGRPRRPRSGAVWAGAGEGAAAAGERGGVAGEPRGWARGGCGGLGVMEGAGGAIQACPWSWGTPALPALNLGFGVCVFVGVV